MPPIVAGLAVLGAGMAATGLGLGALLATTGAWGIAANFGASLLLSGVSQALAGKQSMDSTLASRQVTVREAAKSRELVYGETRKGGAIVYLATSGTEGFGATTIRRITKQVPTGENNADGDPKYRTETEEVKEIGTERGTQMLHLVIMLAAHPIAEIGEIFFDGELAFYGGGSPTLPYLHHAAVLKHYGTGTAFPELRQWLPEWEDRHRLEGCAAIALRLSFQPEAFPNGIPNVTVTLKGRNDIYDPRSGQRGYSDNAALCLANYLEDARYGLGAEIGGAQGLRVDHLIEAANICDEAVQTPTGGWEQRYRCNGVVDTSATPQSVIEGLLSAMAGKAIRKGGLWSLHAGAYRAPSLHLTEDDAAGSLQLVTRLSRAENFNGVRGKFISPENDWQLDDFPAYRSSAYLAEDNHRESWRDISLPFTISAYAAQRIAKIELELARRQMSVTMPCHLKALQVSCGDTVTLTRSRWGFAQKPFVITSMRFEAVADGVGLAPVLALSETSPLVYDWAASEAQIYAAAPRSQLPPVWYLPPPGITEVREELFVAPTGDRVAGRAMVSWSASRDPRVDRYVLEWSTTGEGNWQPVGETGGLSLAHEGWQAGPIRYRLRAIGLLGQRSDWATWVGQLYGLGAPPVALENVTLQTAGGLAVLKWTLARDLDVRIGGRVLIRHAANLEAAWSNSLSMDEVPGSTTNAIVPLMPGVYFLRAMDGSGQLGPIATVFADGAQAIGFIASGLLQADDEFSGSHDGTVGIDGILTLGDVGIFDDVPSVDALSSWDYPTGVVSEGIYTFATTLSWPAAKRVRLRSLVEMAPNVLTDQWDDRAGEVDAWESWDALAESECDVLVQIRTTSGDPSASPRWSDWARLDAGEYLARGVQARALLTSTSIDIAPVVSVLRVIADEVAS